MSSREHADPPRYDFKVHRHDFDQTSVQKVTTEFGQYVNYAAYYNLLCEFSEFEEGEEE